MHRTAFAFAQGVCPCACGEPRRCLLKRPDSGPTLASCPTSAHPGSSLACPSAPHQAKHVRCLRLASSSCPVRSPLPAANPATPASWSNPPKQKKSVRWLYSAYQGGARPAAPLTPPTDHGAFTRQLREMAGLLAEVRKRGSERGGHTGCCAWAGAGAGKGVHAAAANAAVLGQPPRLCPPPPRRCRSWARRACSGCCPKPTGCCCWTRQCTGACFGASCCRGPRASCCVGRGACLCAPGPSRPACACW